MKRIIINADDLGYDDVVNQQIEDCIIRGVVTSTTLLANAPRFCEGVSIAKRYPQISVGVHLNLVEFAPLTNERIFQKHGIANEEGEFINGAIFVVDIKEELAQAIEEEWDAQISKVEQAGVSISHIDSHEHTHAMEALQEVLCRVMEKHHITKVRRKSIPSIRLILKGRKHPIVVLDKSKVVQPPKRNFIYRMIRFFTIKSMAKKWNQIMRENYGMTDYFFPFRDFFYNRSLLQIKGENATIELMCHPGQPSFQTETDNLKNDKSWLPDGFQMISYNDLL